jgi:hypothetical protein
VLPLRDDFIKYVRSGQEAQIATINKAEHTFAAIGIYPYRPNIILDEYLGPYEITCKDKTPVQNLEGTEDGLSNVDPPPRVDGSASP